MFKTTKTTTSSLEADVYLTLTDAHKGQSTTIVPQEQNRSAKSRKNERSYR